MLLDRGVFLDLGSLDNGDLDLRVLKASVDDWRFHPHTAPGEVAERIARAQLVVTNKVMLDRALIHSAPDLALIAVAATGTNNVDLDTARARHITVCNVRDYATEAVAQHTLMLLLSLLTGGPFYHRRVVSGDWSRARHFSLFDRPIREAQGLVLGIVGHGVLGRRVAEMGRCLGMDVLLAERRGQPPRPERHAFDDVVVHADVISLHCPLNEETRNLIDRSVMERMKPGAILINTARGGIVNERDLAGCLREGLIAGAGIDVLGEEPPPTEHPLLADDIPNLLVTPHNAWASRRARQALVDQLARIIHAFERGQPFNRVA